MAFSQNLSKMQAERKETNYRLAKELGVSQTTIANWLSGKSHPLAIYMDMLAKHFGCTVEDLTKEDGDST